MKILVLVLMSLFSVSSFASAFACQSGEAFTIIKVLENKTKGCHDNGNLTTFYGEVEYCISNETTTTLEIGKSYKVCMSIEEELVAVSRATLDDGTETTPAPQ